MAKSVKIWTLTSIYSSSAPLNKNIIGRGGVQPESILSLANSSSDAVKEAITIFEQNYKRYPKIILCYNPPTHEPQSPAPGEPGGVSKWPFNKTDGSLSWESTDEILHVGPRKVTRVFIKWVAT